MVGINPFAKKAEVANATPEMEGHGFNVLSAVADALSHVAKTPSRSRGSWRHVTRDMRAWRKLTVKQRTRLNRDRRNRERQYAKYSVAMRYGLPC